MRKVIFFVAGLLAICLSMSTDGITLEHIHNLDAVSLAVLIILVVLAGVGMAVLGVKIKKYNFLFEKGNDRNKLTSILRMLMCFNLIMAALMLLNVLADFVVLRTWLPEYFWAIGGHGVFFLLVLAVNSYINQPQPRKL